MRIPFGKFKGRVLEELPRDYLDWRSELRDLRDPLRAAIEAERERRMFSQERWESVNGKLVDELVSAGVRVVSKKYHPDCGGSHEEMIAVNAAAHWLRQQARALPA